jgi:HlyD family secretion protein
LEIKAPADGVVYFGQCIEGRWPEMTSLINKLQRYGTASPKSVLMTIVTPRPLYITATVDEGDRPAMEKEQPAKVQPPPEDSKKLSAKVTQVSLAPVSSTKFRVELELTSDDVPEWIVAGMTCDVKVTTYDKEDALVAPKAAVHTDQDDEELRYVWLVDPDDEDAKPERRTVKIGKRDDENIEIVEGLSAGDVISLEDEKDDKKEDGQDDED